MRRSGALGRQDELRHEQIRGELRPAVPDPFDPDLDHDRGAADVERRRHGDDLIAGQAGAEDVELELDRREVVPRRDAAEGRPGGDGVAERGPGTAMDEPTWVQVTPVDDDPAPSVRVLDLQRLDPEVTREAAAEELP